MRPLAVFGVLLLLGPGCMTHPDPIDEALDGSLRYLLDQRDDGGRWDPGFVPHMVEVADAAGLDPRVWPVGLPLAEQATMPPANASYLASLRPLLAATMLRDDALAESARQRVLEGYDGRQFGEPALLNDDAVALRILGEAGGSGGRPARSMAESLLRNQSADHGWSWTVEGAGETDMTGMVLLALQAAGALDGVDPAGVLSFLDATRTADGGHALMAGQERGNCDSTVWAIRAYAILGQPASVTEPAWAFLFGLQQKDGGFAYTEGGLSNTLCTAEAATLLGAVGTQGVPAPAAA